MLRRDFQLAFADCGYKLIELIQSWDVDGEPRQQEVLVLRRPSYTLKVKPELLYARVPDSIPQRRSNLSRKWDGVKSFESHWSQGETRQQRILNQARKIRGVKQEEHARRERYELQSRHFDHDHTTRCQPPPPPARPSPPPGARPPPWPPARSTASRVRGGAEARPPPPPPMRPASSPPPRSAGSRPSSRPPSTPARDASVSGSQYTTSPFAGHPQSSLCGAVERAERAERIARVSLRLYSNGNPLLQEPEWRQRPHSRGRSGTRRPDWDFRPLSALGTNNLRQR